MDELEAISRLKGGDINGLEVLVYKYQVQAIRAAYLITRERSLAEDIVQTAFLRVYERRRQFDPERPFGPWFLRIVVNDAIKAAARGKGQVSLDSEFEGKGVDLADLLPDTNPGPEKLTEEAEVRETIWEALSKLSASQRAVVVLHYYLGLKEREIGQQTGRAPGTVKWLLHAARERLRNMLRSALDQEEIRPRDKGR